MEIRCRRIFTADIAPLYDRMLAEGLLWTLWPQYRADEWNRELFMALTDNEKSAIVCAFVDGEPGGFLHLWPYCGSPFTMAGEVGVCAFREYFRLAPEMCRAALDWVWDNVECSCLLGHVLACNHHVLHILEKSGFKKVCQIKQLGYLARKDRFMDAWLVMAGRPNHEELRGGI